MLSFPRAPFKVCGAGLNIAYSEMASQEFSKPACRAPRAAK